VEVFAVPALGPLAPAGALATASASAAAVPWSLLALAYGAVVGLLLVRLLVRQHRLRRHIATLPVGEPELLARVSVAAGTLGYAHLPEVRVSDAPSSPFTLGPLRPALVLPRWLCQPGARLDAVLLHELAHLQRHDHLLIWLERCVASLFFFWPPVHWVCRQLDEARELACDERAIRRGELSAPAYGEHLLAVVSLAQGRRMLSSALGMGRAGARLERRIVRLLQGAADRSPSAGERAALALLLLCAVFAVRPGHELAQPSAPRLPEAGALPASGETSADAASGASVSSSTAEPALAACELQTCGTQCVPTSSSPTSSSPPSRLVTSSVP
jgi:beta-lactamase regulating signal transducer with metallopeptidase domain